MSHPVPDAPQTNTGALARPRRTWTDLTARAGLGLAILAATLLLAVPGPRQAVADIGPIADLIGDLIDTLEDVEEDLSDAHDAVGTNLGPLVDPSRTAVVARLESAQKLIDRILDPYQSPSLVPGNAGSADASLMPSTLPGYADESLELVEDALIELMSSTPDYELIGSNLRTVETLLPDYIADAGG